jgi:hypothetical protein
VKSHRVLANRERIPLEINERRWQDGGPRIRDIRSCAIHGSSSGNLADGKAHRDNVEVQKRANGESSHANKRDAFLELYSL